MPNFPILTLAPGKSQPLWFGHPWVFEQNIGRISGEVFDGAVVQVVDPQGGPIDFALWSGSSKLPARLLGVGPRWPEGWNSRTLAELWRAKVRAAAALRARWNLPQPQVTEAYRLLNSEGDSAPGVVVDVFGAHCVMQLTTAAAFHHRAALVEALVEVLKPASVTVFSDATQAQREGFECIREVAHGHAPESVQVRENGVVYEVQLGSGQKTGHYMDQRENRARFGALAKGCRALDVHAFTGGFALNAALGGASEVVAIESSANAAAAVSRNAALNALANVEVLTGKCERELAKLAEVGRQFDLISLDPPKLAPSRKTVPQALRKVEALIGQSISVLARQGLLVVASCSSYLGEAELKTALSHVTGRTHRSTRVFQVTHQASDHLYPAAMREGHYLTAVWAVVC